LIDHIKKHAKSASVVQERIKVKEKEKATETTLFRYEGEVVGPFDSGNDDPEEMKEDELVVKDPRLEPGFRRGKSGRVNEFIEVKYDVRSSIVFISSY
jgi:histone-lysine N-methyltransferase SETD1